MKFNQNQFLSCLSTAIDYVEMDYMQDVTHHNRKVAYISDCLAIHFGLDEDDRLDLATYALLHDSGTTSYLFDVAKNRCSIENASEHCVHSERIANIFPMRKPREDILLHHHEYADGSGYFGITLPDLDLFSQIIRLADDVDIWLSQGISSTEIIEKVTSSKKFAADLATAFKEVSSPAAFWFDLSPEFIKHALEKHLPESSSEKTWSEVRAMTRVLSGIIDKKSLFTARHSAGLAEKAEQMAGYYGFDEDKTAQLIIAADLHDIGKLAISNKILDKPEKLTSKEFSIIQKHTYFTRRALEDIEGFEQITDWASDHHEKTTGRGYPLGKTDLCFESRLMGILDTYQALTEERPYRRGLLHEEAMEIILPLGKFGGFDPQIIDDVDKIFNV